MKRAVDVLKTKPSQDVHTVLPSTPILEAIKAMAERNIGALVVVEGNHIVGMVSERDIVRRLATEGPRAFSGEVADIMMTPVLYVKPSHTDDECMALMTDSRLRHLPVVEDGGRLLGVISIGDLVKDTISEQQYVIEQLEHYITGWPA